MFQTPVDPIE
jgi:hypothetical protein